MSGNNTTAKNAAISARVLALVASGLDVREALDRVLGAGTFAKLAGELYAAFRSEGR